MDFVQPETQPKVLVIPTAKHTQDRYDNAVQRTQDLFVNQLGLPMTVLHPFGSMPSPGEAEEKIGEADLVYVAGGVTDKMMDLWHEAGVDGLLKRRLLAGLVLTGISAGAITPFRWGHSASLKYSGLPSWDYIEVPGLDLIPAAVTPHANNKKMGL